jgi:hypothetical protein
VAKAATKSSNKISDNYQRTKREEKQGLEIKNRTFGSFGNL